MTVFDQFDAKLAALRGWFDHTAPPTYGIAHGFALADPMDESELRRAEEGAGIALPSEYRSFLLRYGDGEVGPGCFRPLEKGLSPASRNPFPLDEPFLGCCSPAHQRLSKEAQWEEFGRLSSEWDAIPKYDGVLEICDYGCNIFGVLVLNGPFTGRVWMLSSDSAFYGPFGGAEALHDESTPCEWEPNDAPKDYSFFEWYGSWLDGQMKAAGL